MLFLLFCLSWAFVLPIQSQETLSLEDMLHAYVHRTDAVRQARLAHENALLEYANYQKSFLPSLALAFVPIRFNHSMRLLQNDATGAYSNVNDYTNVTSGGVTLRQRVGLTGGYFSLSSSLSFLHEFSRHTGNFTTMPLSLGYTQPLWGARRQYAYERNVRRKRVEAASKNYASAISAEQRVLLSFYLEAYSHLLDVELLTQTACIADSLYAFAVLKQGTGRITDNECDQIRMQRLQAQLSLRRARFAYEHSLHRLQAELKMDVRWILPPPRPHAASVNYRLSDGLGLPAAKQCRAVWAGGGTAGGRTPLLHGSA